MEKFSLHHIQGPIDWIEGWVDQRLADAGAGPGLIWGVQFLALILLLGVLTWLSAPLCRWVARRLGRLGNQALAQQLSGSAKAVRLVVLLAGLYSLSRWAFAGPGQGYLISGLLFIAVVIAATRGLVRVSQVLLGVAVARMVGLDARLEARLGGAAAPEVPGQRRLMPLSQKLATVVLWLCALAVVLDHFGQSVSSVVTALGVGSLAIGLAAQQSLGNMIAGAVLLIDKPFRVGDRIRLPGLDIGQVEDLGMRSTHIRLGDGNLLIVPNSDLVTSKVVNYCSEALTRGEVRLQVAATTRIEPLAQALEQAAAQEPGVRKEPAPRLVLLSLGDKLDLSLVFLLESDADAPEVEERLRRVVLSHLQQVSPQSEVASPSS